MIRVLGVHGQASTGLEEGLEGRLLHLAARGLAAHGRGSSLASGRSASEIPLGELLVFLSSVSSKRCEDKRLEGAS